MEKLSDTKDHDMWETLIDFTENGKKEGMRAKKFFNLLNKVNIKDK